MLSKSGLDLRWLKIGVGGLLFMLTALYLSVPIRTSADEPEDSTLTAQVVDATMAAYLGTLDAYNTATSQALGTPVTPIGYEGTWYAQTATALAQTLTPASTSTLEPTATEEPTLTPTSTSLPLAGVQLLKPKDGKVMHSSTPIFSWTEVDAAAYYVVEIATDALFENTVQWLYEYPGHPYVQSPPLEAGVYYWRVGSFDNGTYENVYSVTRSFTVHFNAPQVAQECQPTSSNQYDSIPVEQFDWDDPVRSAGDNADKNVWLRGFAAVDQPRELVTFYGPPSDGSPGDKNPPQLATMFSPPRVPGFAEVAQIGYWVFNPSPDPGFQSGYLNDVAVSVVAMEPNEFFEDLQVPHHGRNLGSGLGHGAVVLYADEYSIALHFTREDTANTGYTLHLYNICTDPNLLALYRFLDNADRNSIFGDSGNFPGDGVFDYSLPAVKQGQVFGTSFYNSPVYVAIRDVGTFLDPRAKFDWWQIAPGGGN